MNLANADFAHPREPTTANSTNDVQPFRSNLMIPQSCENNTTVPKFDRNNTQCRSDKGGGGIYKRAKKDMVPKIAETTPTVVLTRTLFSQGGAGCSGHTQTFVHCIRNKSIDLSGRGSYAGPKLRVESPPCVCVVLRCVVLCCAVLCCAVLWRGVVRCGVFLFCSSASRAFGPYRGAESWPRDGP